MQKDKHEFTVDGYGSGETDFLVRLSQDGIMQQLVIDTIIDPIVAILASGDDGAVLTVAGHSDRVDTAGLSHIDRLAQEADASLKRAQSAIEGIHAMVQQRSPGAPSDLDTLPFFFVFRRFAGAAVLINDAATLSDAERRQNRRVQIRLVVFTP